jgi:hypothetical protein
VITIEVPGLSAPGKLLLLGSLAVTSIVQLLATAVPPLSLTTCLITVSEASLSAMFTIAEIGAPRLTLGQPVILVTVKVTLREPFTTLLSIGTTWRSTVVELLGISILVAEGLNVTSPVSPVTL